MHLSTASYIAAAIAATCSSATASFVEKEAYLAKIAPVMVDRISKYRASKGSLTEAQVAVLEQAEKVVRNYDVDNITSLEIACNGAFSKDECRKILAGESNVASRAFYCNCSAESDYCPYMQRCMIGVTDCTFRPHSCGTLGLYTCTGVCRRA